MKLDISLGFTIFSFKYLDLLTKNSVKIYLLYTFY